MNSTAPLLADAPSGSALADTWRQLRRQSLRHALVVGGLCLGIAVLLTAADGGRFSTKLIYSLSIGAMCTLVVALVRLAVAGATDQLRRTRGMPLEPIQNSWRSALPGALVAMVLGPSLGVGLADWITGYSSTSLLDFASAGTRTTIVLGVLGTVVALTIIGSMESLYAARARAEASQRQAAENQLRLLQSQLEPHMLFNTLANLRVLIGLDAERAQAMLDRLIAFLRAMLNASRLSAHPLATEFERLADYLALMGVRMGPRLQTRLDLPPALRDLPVPPLLLQPLVENAIKHGLEPQVKPGRVEVSARAEGDALVLRVRDTGQGLSAAAAAKGIGSHFGLAQVRERLATLHGQAASLTLADAADAEGGTLATLRLPLPTPAPPPASPANRP
jgi:signal transduction histidine kinase